MKRSALAVISWFLVEEAISDTNVEVEPFNSDPDDANPAKSCIEVNEIERRRKNNLV